MSNSVQAESVVICHPTMNENASLVPRADPPSRGGGAVIRGCAWEVGVADGRCRGRSYLVVGGRGRGNRARSRGIQEGEHGAGQSGVLAWYECAVCMPARIFLRAVFGTGRSVAQLWERDPVPELMGS